jgi:hypothetical protein
MPTKLPAKQKGEWAEVCFAAEVLRRGWGFARPNGDSGSYDCIVDAGGRLWRVQVKSVEKRVGKNRFHVTIAAGRNRKRRYSARQVDLLAILVIPLRSWYLIPLATVRGRVAITLSPRGKWEKYCEGWENLRG